MAAIITFAAKCLIIDIDHHYWYAMLTRYFWGNKCSRYTIFLKSQINIFWPAQKLLWTILKGDDIYDQF